MSPRTTRLTALWKPLFLPRVRGLLYVRYIRALQTALRVSPYAPVSVRREYRKLFTTYCSFRSGMRSLVAILAVMLTVQQSEAFIGGGIMASGVAAAGPRRSSNRLKMADVVVEFTQSKKTVTAVVGTPLSQLCAKNKIKVKYSCKQGDCATCSINIDGRYVKACQGRVPASRRIIKIKA